MGAIPHLAMPEINLRRVAGKRLNPCRTALQGVKFPTLNLRDTNFPRAFCIGWPNLGLARDGTASLPSRRCAGRFVTTGRTKNVLSYL
jgi:hypothetical protein